MEKRDKMIAIILLVVMLLNFADVITDSQLGVPLWHIIGEGMIVFIAGCGALFLFLENRRRRLQIGHLKSKLQHSDIELEKLSREMRQARAEFAQAINHQFAHWNLTKSEQQIAMLLLKGLSLREIGTFRETTEKTVRQHASSIYSKAGVEGRHEFAAWFLEDLVNQTVSEAA